MSETSLTVKTPDRASEVLNQIAEIRNKVVGSALDLAFLLAESRREKYYLQWGFGSLAAWLGDSGLEIEARQAHYLIGIAEGSTALGIGRPELEKVKISVLKEIFRLDPETNAGEIKALVAKGGETSLEEVKDRVEKTLDPNSEGWKRLNFKLRPDAAQVVNDALDHVRDAHGTVINEETGEVEELSSSRCLEMLAAEYLSGTTELHTVQESQ